MNRTTASLSRLIVFGSPGWALIRLGAISKGLAFVGSQAWAISPTILPDEQG